MKRETRRYFRDLGYFSSLGFQIAIPIIIGFVLGSYLDEKVFDSTPWAMLICLALGIAAGCRNVLLAIKKINKL
ncbi:MAG: AtpZ/AtpI family protein [Desulfobacterales bacterium]|nr:AtpZ/AtpI family protein [Desulfobacterales bacterium]